MTVETVPGYYIHAQASVGKMLTNGDVIAKEIFAPLEGDITMWYEIDEPAEETYND